MNQVNQAREQRIQLLARELGKLLPNVGSWEELREMAVLYMKLERRLQKSGKSL